LPRRRRDCSFARETRKAEFGEEHFIHWGHQHDRHYPGHSRGDLRADRLAVVVSGSRAAERALRAGEAGCLVF
jgi:hypothetical protein